jgi:rhodanese-related sulfurtransferase
MAWWFYCLVGWRTKRAERTLLDGGVDDVYRLQGGFAGWLSENLTKRNGRKPRADVI